MSIDLLAPRYKVIADYPNSPYRVGDLVEISKIGTTFHCTTTKVFSQFDDDMIDSVNYFHIDKINDWPHLFQPLPWYAERAVSDLPKYTQFINSTTNETLYCKIEKYEIDAVGDVLAYTKDHGLGYIRITHIDFPATEQDYLNYHNNK